MVPHAARGRSKVQLGKMPRGQSVNGGGPSFLLLPFTDYVKLSDEWRDATVLLELSLIPVVNRDF